MEKIHTREILALLERLENKTWLPQWQKHRARLGEDPAVPTRVPDLSPYLSDPANALLLEARDFWGAPETRYCCVCDHHYQIGPLHSPYMFMSLDFHSKFSVCL